MKWKGGRNVHPGGTVSVLSIWRVRSKPWALSVGLQPLCVGQMLPQREAVLSTICTACNWHIRLLRSIWGKVLGQGCGNTQLDPGTKLNLDLPLSLEWEVLWHDQFMTHTAAIAGDNMLWSTGFFFSPGWPPWRFLCSLCSTRWITSKRKTINCTISKLYMLKCY